MSTDRQIASDSRPPIDGLLERHGAQLALAAAWTAMLGSLYFSEVMHFEPCRLCWFQRILMYPIALIGLVGILRADRGASLYILPLSFLGMLVSGYHVLLQHGFFSESNACLRGVPCSARYINWMGFVTIPVLALAGFLVIGFASSAALRAAPRDDPFRRRVLAALIPVAAVLACFALLLITRT